MERTEADQKVRYRPFKVTSHPDNSEVYIDGKFYDLTLYPTETHGRKYKKILESWVLDKFSRLRFIPKSNFVPEKEEEEGTG